MDALTLLKMRLGIKSGAKDAELKSIIDGVADELQNVQGVQLTPETSAADMRLLVDYAAYRHQNAGDTTDAPKHLQWRLKNRYLHEHTRDKGANKNDV